MFAPALAALSRALHCDCEGGGALVAARVNRRATGARKPNLEPAARPRTAGHGDGAVEVVLGGKRVGDADAPAPFRSMDRPAGGTCEHGWRQVEVEPRDDERARPGVPAAKVGRSV